MCEKTTSTAFGLYLLPQPQPQPKPRAIGRLDEMKDALFKKVRNTVDAIITQKSIPLSIDLVTVISNQNSFEGSFRCVFCCDTIKLYCDSAQGR